MLARIFQRCADIIIARARRTPFWHLTHANGVPYMDRFWLMPKFLLRETAKGHWAHELVQVVGTPYREVRKVWVPLPSYDLRWWWLPALRVHRIRSSDADRHLHDHPWATISLLLKNGYLEIMPRDQRQHPRLDQMGHLIQRQRKAGNIVLRGARDRHRLVIPKYTDCYSLFIMFGWAQPWGFHTEEGWVDRKNYLIDRSPR